MDRGTKLALTVAAALIALFSILISPNQTIPLSLLDPPQIPGSQDRLHTAQTIPVQAAVGPESLAFDPTGNGPYTGVADGRILKWQGDVLGWTDFAFTTSNRTECGQPFAPEKEHVCGRPLGLRFYKKTGDLYIADAYHGFLVVGPQGGVATPIATGADGQPLYFTNDMDIDEVEDVIYFSDSSTVFRRREFMSSILNGDKTGRLLKYDIATKRVTVLLQDLAFANGVALSKDRSFVLVVETTTFKIVRLWLNGPNAGKSDVFAEFPGFPDNIRRNSEGEFWVALHSKKGLFANLIVSYPWFGKSLLKLPLDFKQLHQLLVGKPHATVIKLSDKGEILNVLEDCEGKTLRFISEVEEKDGKLWLGSVLMPFIGVYNL